MKNKNFEAEMAVAVADLLVEEAKMLRKNHYSQSQKCNLQALLLYKKTQLTTDASVPLNIQQTISQLEEKLQHTDQLEAINKLVD